MHRTSQMNDKQFAAFIAARPVSGGKGDDVIRQQEEQQAAFNKQLAQTFSSQFAAQSGILNFLNSKLTAQLTNPTGFSPEELAALHTSNTEAASKAFAHAQQATQAAVAARGGSTLPSGVGAQLTAANANAGATQLASGENEIALADAAQKQSNYWNALSGLSGVAQQENPAAYAGLYNGGSSNVAGLGEAYNATQQSPLLATLGGLAGGGISALTAYMGRPKPPNSNG